MAKKSFSRAGFEYNPKPLPTPTTPPKRVWHCFEETFWSGYRYTYCATVAVPLRATRSEIIAACDRAMFGPY